MDSFKKGLLLTSLSIILTGCGGGTTNIRPDQPDDPPFFERPPLDPSKCMPYTTETAYRIWNQSTCNFEIDEPVARNIFETTAYKQTESVNMTKAWNAWARGITGAGVKVAVIDSGISTDADVNEKVVERGVFGADYTDNNLKAHGSGVASVIADTGRDASVGGWKGVAPGASIIDVQAGEGDGTFYQNSIVTGGKWAIDQGAKIINLSLGGGGWTDLSLHRKARDNDVLLVWSAGNNHDATDAQRSASECLYDASFCDTNIVVGGVVAPYNEETGEYDLENAVSRGNKAGDMKDHFLVAAFTTKMGGTTNTSTSGSGTSFSAPAVSGAAALVKERHAHLTSGEVKAILLESATDLGEVGVDEVFGHGLLNIKGAMAPLGDFGFSTSSTVNSAPKQSAAIVTSNINMKSFALSTTAAFDKYGRDFAISNADLTKQAIQTATVNALNVSDIHTRKDFDQNVKSGDIEVGISANKKGLKAKVADGVKVGISQETDSFLGSDFKGLFGGINTTSATVEVEKNLIKTANSYVKANAQAKASVASGSDSFTKSMNAMAVDLGVEAGINVNGVLIKGSVALPNNVVAGKANFILPQGRTLDGQVISKEVSSDIKSEFAPVLSASIETMLSEEISFQAGAQTNGMDIGVGAGVIRRW